MHPRTLPIEVTIGQALYDAIGRGEHDEALKAMPDTTGLHVVFRRATDEEDRVLDFVGPDLLPFFVAAAISRGPRPADYEPWTRALARSLERSECYRDAPDGPMGEPGIPSSFDLLDSPEAAAARLALLTERLERANPMTNRPTIGQAAHRASPEDAEAHPVPPAAVHDPVREAEALAGMVRGFSERPIEDAEEFAGVEFQGTVITMDEAAEAAIMRHAEEPALFEVTGVSGTIDGEDAEGYLRRRRAEGTYADTSRPSITHEHIMGKRIPGETEEAYLARRQRALDTLKGSVAYVGLPDPEPKA